MGLGTSPTRMFFGRTALYLGMTSQDLSDRACSASRMNVARATLIPRYDVGSPCFHAKLQLCALFVAENVHKCRLAGGRELLLLGGLLVDGRNATGAKVAVVGARLVLALLLD